MIDSAGEPKASYYASKRFYAPVLLSLVRDGSTVTAHLVNDTLDSVDGELNLSLRTFDGTLLASEASAAAIGANGSGAVACFDFAAVSGQEHRVYVHGTFTSAVNPQKLSAENFLFFAEPKDWHLAGRYR